VTLFNILQLFQFLILKKTETFAVGWRRKEAAGQKKGWIVSYLSWTIEQRYGILDTCWL